MIQDPVAVLAALLAILATLFAVKQHPRFGKIFNYVPLLVFAYFVPTLCSNVGLIPIHSPLYTWIKQWLLPASLVLLTLSVDIPAIVRLGKQAISLFLIATFTLMIGGPLSYLLFHGLVPESLGAEAWKGLAALCGSWIGGTANMIAVGESVGVQDSTLQMMVIVDVAVANVWMAVLLYFAGKDKAMDQKIGADRSSMDACRKKIEDFQLSVERVATLADLLLICAIAFVGTALATWIASYLPDIGDIIKTFTWVVILVTAFGVLGSLTPLRKLEGAGASKVGSLFLYLLVASIGAHAEFTKIMDAPVFLVMGAGWMLFHAVFLLLARRWLRAPIFFAAVGSKANVGGAASAPIVAAAFHPALAPVGIILAVGGYVLGTYGGLFCAYLLQKVYLLVH